MVQEVRVEVAASEYQTRQRMERHLLQDLSTLKHEALAHRQPLRTNMVERCIAQLVDLPGGDRLNCIPSWREILKPACQNVQHLAMTAASGATEVTEVCTLVKQCLVGIIC